MPELPSPAACPSAAGESAHHTPHTTPTDFEGLCQSQSPGGMGGDSGVQLGQGTTAHKGEGESTMWVSVVYGHGLSLAAP